MKKIITFLTIFILLATLSYNSYAVCPVCTLAVGAGIGISRWIGIDNSIMGLWIGGLVLSSSLWLSDVIKRKGIKIKYPEIFTLLIMWLFVLTPLYFSGMMGLKDSTILGIDKIIFGMVIGFTVFWFSILIDKFLRSKNNGNVHIYYQKVILPIFLLSIFSLVLYLVTI